ncbi:FAD-dependent oxidoreductase [Echinimonas agarilytica]|uniref:FAD-dependent oxidoreductase n=1 Tax=Echinimonas agarilytica TaxID=1215918 RepID=A0AA41W7B0_9GAMM|nr:FAD-dependent oxidoreductase [Echinimonas agarilytica]MCM2679768.1 FAD-dependent oxidoreductase [Echinimonas agarilytica]
MIIEKFNPDSRENKTNHLTTEFVVVGGGLAGVCAAISAARTGTQVILVQDRPVLGGNASSEVRLWALGATSHMGNNNRWSREGGVIDEIMLDNLRVNPEGNPLIFDTVLLDKVVAESNITLLLNTAAQQVHKSDDTTITRIDAFCSQNSTQYSISAPLFCDATGDGLVAFNAGAAFRIGAEAKTEFNELLASDEANTELLGHTLFFYSKKMNKPVSYSAPKFAYTQEEIGAIPRCGNIQGHDSGCKFWWIEFGGVKDTIYETEDIKWELWKIVYGIWDYIKNSGKFDDVDNLTLEWVGTVPGKRESRRFEGEYMLTQSDIVEQTEFSDAVSYGGWAIDIHPAEGIYSDRPACSQFHSKGVYQIPYRCFVSKDIDNLFYAGRIISASHMAFGSTRVMITCAHGGQAVGAAAAMCIQQNCSPKSLLAPQKMQELQQRLSAVAHGIPGITLDQSQNKAATATLSASSELALSTYESNGDYQQLCQSSAQLVPLQSGPAPLMAITVKATEATQLTCQLRTSSKPANYTPDEILKTIEIPVEVGEQCVSIDFSDVNVGDQYGFICFLANDAISLPLSDRLITGTLAVFNKVHKAVSNTGRQTPPPNSGIDEFELWTPERRPNGQNLAMTFSPPLAAFNVEQVVNGHVRPWLKANAWVSDLSDPQPRLTLTWPEEVTIEQIDMFFDSDSDHALETVLMEHPETVIPYCVQRYRIKTAEGKLIADVNDNHQTMNRLCLASPIQTQQIVIEFSHPSDHVPAALFGIEIH